MSASLKGGNSHASQSGISKALRQAATRFDSGRAKRVEYLLNKIRRCQDPAPQFLIEWHATLLFLLAYPANEKLQRQTEQTLFHVAARVKQVFSGSNHHSISRLTNSGIAGSVTYAAYSLELTRWIREIAGYQVTLFSIDAPKESVEQVLCAMLPAVTRDCIADKLLTPQGMIARLKGKQEDALAFLLRLFITSPHDATVKDALWDSLKIFVRWELHHEGASLSDVRAPDRKLFYHKGPLMKKLNHRHVFAKALTPVTSENEDKKMIVQASRIVLALLLRETEPVTYAQEQRVELFDGGRGLDIALFQMKTERRLPLESYIGYVAFKNRIPVAYGGGWCFLHRCKTGINILPAFRGGESSWLFSRVLAAYCQHYGVKKFFVEPYQFGKSNPEGLKSGAFWFYYRLGFRPADSNLKMIAAEEWELIKADKSYRTPIKTLRQFTQHSLEWNASVKTGFPDADPLQIAEAIHATVTERYQGDEQRAIRQVIKKFKDRKTVATLNQLSVTQRHAVENLLLLTLLHEKWQPDDYLKLIGIAALKNGNDEREFILASQQNPHFFCQE